MKKNMIRGNSLVLVGLCAILIALVGCTSPEKASNLAKAGVDLAPMLYSDTTKLIYLSGKELIQCPDTITNSGPETSASTMVYFYIATDPKKSETLKPLFTYPNKKDFRWIRGLPKSKSWTRPLRPNNEALFEVPATRPTGRMYIVARVVPAGTDYDVYYDNNETSVPIEFGP